MRNFRLFAGVIIFFLFTLTARAEEPAAAEKISYKQYLQEVLAYYPSLKKEQANIEKTIAQKALTAANRLPHLWLSAQYNYGNDPVYVFGALLRQNKFTNDDFALDRLNKPSAYSDNSAGIAGEWLLFDFA